MFLLFSVWTEMNSFWLLLFIIKLYSRINIFKFIKKKHGNDIYTLVRTFESIKIRYEKTLLDIKFLKICKVEHLIPTFANIRLGTSGTNIAYNSNIVQLVSFWKMNYNINIDKREGWRVKLERLASNENFLLFINMQHIIT